jgi:hypothetical protein
MNNSFTVRLAGMAEHDAKHPAAPSFAVGSRDPRSGAEIYLSFFTGSDLHASHKLWHLLLQPRYIPPHALILRGETKLIDQILPDPLSCQTLFQLAQNLVPIRLTLAA